MQNETIPRPLCPSCRCCSLVGRNGTRRCAGGCKDGAPHPGHLMRPENELLTAWEKRLRIVEGALNSRPEVDSWRVLWYGLLAWLAVGVLGGLLGAVLGSLVLNWVRWR